MDIIPTMLEEVEDDTSTEEAVEDLEALKKKNMTLKVRLNLNIKRLKQYTSNTSFIVRRLHVSTHHRVINRSSCRYDIISL